MRPLLTVAYLSHHSPHSPSFNKFVQTDTIVSNFDQICLKKKKIHTLCGAEESLPTWKPGVRIKQGGREMRNVSPFGIMAL